MRVNSWRMVAVVVVLMLPGMAAWGQITNAGFEEPVHPSGAAGNEQFTNLYPNSPPGWTYAYEANMPTANLSWGIQDPASGFYGTDHPLPDPFEGNQFGFINMNLNGTVARADSDILSVLGANEQYKLNVAVGGRNNGSWRDIIYSIGLVAQTPGGNVELGTFANVRLDPGSSPTNITDLEYILDVSGEAAAAIGNPFFIRIRSTNTGEGGTGAFTQANFDNVRLDVAIIPEPGTLALIGCAAVVGLLRRRV